MNQEILSEDLLFGTTNIKGATTHSKPTTLAELGENIQQRFKANKSHPEMAGAETSQIERFVYNDPNLPVIDILVVVEDSDAPDDPTIIYLRLADNIIHVDVMKRMAEAQFRVDVSNYLVQRYKSGRPCKLNHPSCFGHLVRYDREIFTKIRLGIATANDYEITPLAF
jgi:hypothetical protein